MKKITIVLSVETDKNFDTIENAILRGLDYGFEKYEITEDQPNPDISVEEV